MTKRIVFKSGGSKGILRATLYSLLFATFFVMPYISVLRYGFPIVVLGDTSLTALTKDVFVVFFVAIGAFLSFVQSKSMRFDKLELSLIVLILLAFLRALITTATFFQAVASFRHEIFFVVFSLVLYRLCKMRMISPGQVDHIFSSVLFFNVIVVIGIGYVEMANKDFLSVLYGDKANNLVTGIPGMPEIRAVSTLENPINLALFINLGIFYFLASAPKVRVRYIFLGLFALPLVVATLSRVFILMYVIGLLYSMGSYLKSLPLQRAILLSSILIVAIFSVVGYVDLDYAEFISVDALEKRFDQTLSFFDSMDDPRFDNWKIAFKEFGSPPVLGELMGMGLGVSNPGEILPGQFRIENTFLTVLLQLGGIGFIVFFLPFFLVVFCYLLLPRARSFFARKYIYIVLIVLVGGVTNDTHRNMPFSLYLWVGLVMAAMFSYSRKNEELNV